MFVEGDLNFQFSPINTGSMVSRLQKIDFYTKHMTNLNFNKNVSINLDFVPKTEKTLEKKRITQAQKISFVLTVYFRLGQQVLQY